MLVFYHTYVCYMSAFYSIYYEVKAMRAPIILLFISWIGITI